MKMIGRTHILLTMAISVVYFSFCCISDPVLGASTDTFAAIESPLRKQGIHQTNIDSSSLLTLVENGKPVAEIVVANESPVVQYAAEELQKRVQQATDAVLPIVSQRTEGVPAIMLGDNSWLRQTMGVDVDTLPRDGYVIKKIADAIAIAGKDNPFEDPAKTVSKGIWAQTYQRATLFGVYDFLQRFVGVRYYFPDELGIVVPKYNTLTVPAMDIVEAPDFAQRRTSWYHSGKSFTGDDQGRDFRLGNLDMYRLRAETMILPNNHGLIRLGLVDRFGEEHPGYFALLDTGKRDNDMGLPGHHGHLCYSSEGLRQEIYKDAEAFLTGKPASTRGAKTKDRVGWSPSAFQPGFFNIMPPDGLGPIRYCHCPQCQEYVENGNYDELIWQFIADIANQLKSNGVSGYITCMAYSTYKRVPDVDLPDNVLVMLAVPGPWLERDPEAQQEYDQLIQDWNAKIAPHRVWLWNYANKYGARNLPGIPTSTPHAIGDYYQRIAPDIAGAFLLSSTDHFLFNYLNWYVFCQVAWDNEVDVNEILQEHHRLMFGAGAEPMGLFFDTIERLWLEECLGETADSPLGPITVAPPSESQLWELIYSTEMINKLEGYFQEAKALVKNDSKSLKRIAFIQEHFLGNIEKQRRAYFDRNRRIKDLVFEVPRFDEDTDLVMDGSLDDSAWQHANQVMLVPLEDGVPILAKTSVSALWSDQYIYFGFDCRESKVDQLFFSKREDDAKQIWRDSSVEVFLNPSGMRTSYYQFIINPAGSFTDISITTPENAKKKLDLDWDAGVKVKTQVTDHGWTAELAIPITALTDGNPLEPGTRWTANFCRSRNLQDATSEQNQLYTWSPYLKKGFHEIERFGTLRFVTKTKTDDSLIENGDFSQIDKRGLPVGWHPPNDPDKRALVSLDESYFISGGRSIKIEGTDEPVILMQRLPDLEPNQTYLLTFFAKTENITVRDPEKGGAGACVNLWTSKNEWFPSNWYTGTMPWTKQGFVIQTDREVNKNKTSYIRLRLGNANGTVWYDDIRLRKQED